jgi:hypothetical protein
MNNELSEYLDGERELEELSPEAQAEAEAWRRLTGEMKADEPRQAPVWMENAVMSQIALADAPKENFLGWLLRPRTIRLSPLSSLAMAAAAVAVIALLPNGGSQAPQPGPGAVAVTEILVEFSLEAPGATTVAVAGDFSGWESEFVLDDADGDGIWTGRIPIEPGVHQYMFVINGTDWVTDPRAQRYSDDGFGNRNAVLAVSPPPVL